MNTTAKLELRTLVRGAYDIQMLRIQMGNRIVGNFKVKLGQEPGKKEGDIDAEGQRLLKSLRESYARLTDGVATFPRQAKFKGDGVIDTYTEFCLMAQYVELEASEKGHFARLGKVVEKFPIWEAFLKDVKGIGPAMAGVIISEIDITRARYASSLWKYAGLDVAQDGRGRSRKKEHLVKATYTNRQGEEAERDSITFNPFLKTKLTGVAASSFLRAGGKYADIYYDYKHRLENNPAHAEKTKGHRHNMAMRYAVKMFLMDLYLAWRALEGLEVSRPYHEAKLGLMHGGVAA